MNFSDIPVISHRTEGETTYCSSLWSHFPRQKIIFMNILLFVRNTFKIQNYHELLVEHFPTSLVILNFLGGFFALTLEQCDMQSSHLLLHLVLDILILFYLDNRNPSCLGYYFLSYFYFSKNSRLMLLFTFPGILCCTIRPGTGYSLLLSVGKNSRSTHFYLQLKYWWPILFLNMKDNF